MPNSSRCKPKAIAESNPAFLRESLVSKPLLVACSARSANFKPERYFSSTERMPPMRKTRWFVMLAVTLLLATVASDRSSLALAPVALPNPVLVYTGDNEYFSTGGKDFVRYRFFVENFEAYPKDMFAAAPALPPCGKNTKSSRTWVDFFTQSGKRLNQFCALGTPADLNKIWFALPADEVPPSWVYIEMNDRETSTKYKSNLAETTL